MTVEPSAPPAVMALLSARPRGPRVAPVDCPACGKKVDPLRAGHVAIFAERFHFFCDHDCRERYLIQHPELVTEALFATASSSASSRPDVSSSDPLEPLEQRADDPHSMSRLLDDIECASDLIDLNDSDSALEMHSSYASIRSDPSALLNVGTTVLGVVSLAIALMGTSDVALISRLAVALLGMATLVASHVITPRDPSLPQPVAVLAPLVAACAIGIWCVIADHSLASDAVTLVALLVVSTGASLQLVQLVRRDLLSQVQSIEHSLQAPARRITSDGYAVVASSSLRPGEEVLIDSLEVVPADVMISAGEATVLAWLGARSAMRRQAGQSLVAGAQVLSGRLRATVSWSGLDRAWVRSTLDSTRAPHVTAPVVRHARMIVERWAPIMGAVVALAAFANGMSTPHVLLSAVAAYGALAAVSTGSMSALHVLRSVLRALDRGIGYSDAAAWDRAAQTTAVVFCARGTLLLGEPQVAEIVAVHQGDAEQLLALAAGAGALSDDPITLAIRTAARERSVTVDAVRSPVVAPGLGVTAVASTGEALCVGSRALMLRERISIASVEQKLAELEAMGRTVVLVSLKDKLRGFIALQDGLRPGARNAVQQLLDGGIEPVLMASDARETCEAIARSLDIEHVRPELLAADRGEQIKGMSESGATVAVIGRMPADAMALDAADVAIVLEGAGSTLGNWPVSLAADDVRDASRALVWAKHARAQARWSIIIGLAPGIAAGLSIAFGLLPPAYAPLAVLASSVCSYLQIRAVEPPSTFGGLG